MTTDCWIRWPGRRALPGRMLGAATLLAHALVPACAGADGPRLDAVIPGAAARGAMVTIGGQHLCGASADCAHAGGEIQIGIDPPVVRAVIVAYADREAQIVIPQAAGVGDTVLVVTVNEQSSNALAFEVLP